MSISYKTMPVTPIGKIGLAANDKGVSRVLWEKQILEPDTPDVERAATHNELLRQTEEELQEYFAGTRRVFSVKLMQEGTEFQKKVWAAVAEIPFGETRTYAQIAARVGNPRAVRAVGQAIGLNPIPVIVPCHRVVGSNTRLTGFSGGLAIKAQLLALEGYQTP